MKYLREDNDNCRVYYRGPSGALYCYQEDRPQQFTLYVCSQDGEPSHPVTAKSPFPPPPGETSTGQALIVFLGRTPCKAS